MKVKYNDGLSIDYFDYRYYTVNIKPFKELPKDFPKRKRSFEWLCKNLDENELKNLISKDLEWLEFI